MQVAVKNVNEIGREMTITVEDINIDDAVQQRLKAIAPTVKMAGFRQGKVPMKMIEQTHSGEARGDVIDGLVQSSMQEAFTQEKIESAGPPHISKMDEKDGNLVYTIEFEVFPTIDKINVKGLTVEKIVAEIADADVDEMLETLRNQRMEWLPVKRAAKETDGVTIDFVGRVDGEIFDGGTGSDVFVEIGNGSMLPEFEKQLVGQKTGGSTTIKMTFPKDYRAEHLAGKKAEFDVTVNTVSEKKLPKLDKAFAELCGVKDIATLKKDVRGNMQRELDSALKNQNKRKVMDVLFENNTLTLPSSPVEREAQFLMDQASNNIKSQGIDVASLNLEVDGFKAPAERRVALSLLVNKIIMDNKITPAEDRVKKIIDGIAESYEDPEDVVKYYMETPEKLSEVQMIVVEDAVVDWVLGNVKVKEVSSSFGDVMSQNVAA